MEYTNKYTNEILHKIQKRKNSKKKKIEREKIQERKQFEEKENRATGGMCAAG